MIEWYIRKKEYAVIARWALLILLKNKLFEPTNNFKWKIIGLLCYKAISNLISNRCKAMCDLKNYKNV